MSNFMLRIDCKSWLRITLLAVMLGLWTGAVQAEQSAPVNAPNLSEVQNNVTKLEGDVSQLKNEISEQLGEMSNKLEETRKPPRTEQGMVLGLYVAILVLFIAGLHALDSRQTHNASMKVHSEFMKKLPDKLAPEQCTKVADDLVRLNQSMTGIPGTTRSIVTYALLAILGIAIFHLLVMETAAGALELADKYLSILAGSVTSIVGFYYGSKVTQEAAKNPKGDNPAPQATTPAARIEKIDPPQAKPEDSVTIHGEGFGTQAGAVQFGSLQADVNDGDWTDRYIKVKIPKNAGPGETKVSVNPPFGKIAVDNRFKVLPTTQKT